MTAFEKYEIVEREYIGAVSIIKRLVDLKSGSRAYSRDYSNALYNFESAIQGVLIYVALEIGGISLDAERLIRDNHISGDIFREINAMGKRKLFSKWVPLSWSNIFDSGLDNALLLEIVHNAAAAAVQNFVYPLCRIDADITSENYASLISEHVKRIIQAFCSPEIISGDSERSIDLIQKTMDGITAGMKVFNEVFLAYWTGSSKID